MRPIESSRTSRSFRVSGLVTKMGLLIENGFGTCVLNHADTVTVTVGWGKTVIAPGGKGPNMCVRDGYRTLILPTPPRSTSRGEKFLSW